MGYAVGEQRRLPTRCRCRRREGHVTHPRGVGTERIAREHLGPDQDVVELAPIPGGSVGVDLLERWLDRPTPLPIDLPQPCVRHGNPDDIDAIGLGVSEDAFRLLLVSLGDSPGDLVDSTAVTQWVDDDRVGTNEDHAAAAI